MSEAEVGKNNIGSDKENVVKSSKRLEQKIRKLRECCILYGRMGHEEYPQKSYDEGNVLRGRVVV